MNTNILKSFLLWMLWLLTPLYCIATNRNYQVEDGLSYNSVWTICQDNLGFLWVGTKDGLNRFDGHSFKIYQKRPGQENSLGNNFIHKIAKLHDGRLLIGTANGLFLYIRTTDNFLAIPLLDGSQKQPTINDIIEDNNGNVWIATHGHGLFALDKELHIKEHFSYRNKSLGIPSNYIWSLCTDSHNNLWLGTAGFGFSMFNSHARTFINYNKCDNISVKGQAIYSLWSDNDGSLWIGTSSVGLIHYNPSANIAQSFLTNITNIKSIQQTSPDKLIMGTENGVMQLDKHTHQVLNLTEGNINNGNYNAVFDIEQDRNGGLWVGTYFNGLNFFHKKAESVLTCFPIGMPSPRITVSSFVEQPNGNIFVATHNSNHLYNFNPATNSIGVSKELPYENVQDMGYNRDNLLVAYAGKGIDCFATPSLSLRNHLKYNLSEGSSVFLMPDGSQILALESGGVVYVPVSGKNIELESLKNILVNGVIQDSYGNIWFSTYSHGLYIWSKDRKWQNLRTLPFNRNELGLYNLTCITQCRDNIWIGTEENGLIVVNASNHKVLKCIDASSGLFSNAIYSIICDKKNRIWASTKDNIVCIDEKDWSIRFMGRHDKSTPSNIHKAFCASDGSLYFGGTKGFYRICPNLIEQPNTKANLCYTNINDGLDALTLDYDQNTINIGFALLDFSNPTENIYRFRLSGLDSKWTYTNNPQANYMNLPEGEYTFEVYGSNGNGIWIKGKELRIEIKPPFWRSMPMLILYAIVLLLGITALFIYYNRWLQHKQAERQKEFEIAHEREMYEQKIGFFTNIAHEIRTPLTLISGPLESILRSKDTPHEVRHHLETIQRNTTRLLALVSQLLDFRKIENDMFQLNIRYQRVQTIIQRVCEQYMPEAIANNITLTVKMPQYEVLAYIDAEALYKIISNLLSNALKFTRSEVTIELTLKKDSGIISVTDNGNGISKENINSVFEPFFQVKDSNMLNRGTGLGLSLSKSLTLKMNGTLSVDEKYISGARFLLQLPMMTDKKTLPVETTGNIEDENATTDGKSCVLVVEDNEDLIQFMHDTLSINYRVLTAPNGQEALNIVESNDIDIIISDVMMPVMDGLEMCEQLKNNPNYSHLPIILLSAKTDVETKVKGLNWGADVYLDKPFSVEQLIAQIESILLKRKQVHKTISSDPLEYYKKTVTKKDENSEFMSRLTTIILDKMSDRDFNVDMLVKEFATNRSDFQKKVKKVTGLTPNDYIKLIRMNKSAEMLATGKYRINEVCAIIGFNSPSYFSKCFYEQFGKLPKDFIS